MTQADDIRRYVWENYIIPARARGADMVTVRAGDVHGKMGLTSALPAVCSAIGGRKFLALSGAVLESRQGPANGANVFFSFRVGVRPSRQPPEAPRREAAAEAPRKDERGAADDRDTIVLVSCVKSKLPHAAPARSLYTSAWFLKVRDLVETSGARWFVLSSRYGLVAPDAVIDTYDYTLNTLGVAERRSWAEKVMRQLNPRLAGARRVVMLAGARYREFLVEPLRKRGIQVEAPMAHLRRGEQLSWLTERK